MASCGCRTAALWTFVYHVTGLRLAGTGARNPHFAHGSRATRLVATRSSVSGRRTLNTQTPHAEESLSSTDSSPADIEYAPSGHSNAETARSAITPEAQQSERKSTRSMKGEQASKARKESEGQTRRQRSGGESKTDSAKPPKPARKKEDWQLQKQALAAKFPEGWQPRKKLSPDALAGIRALHKQFPDEYPTKVLAERFAVSPEAIRRILKSGWAPSPEEEQRRQERWFERGKQVWARWAELGKKPPRRWRQEGVVRDPIWNEKRRSRTRRDEDEWDEDERGGRAQEARDRRSPAEGRSRLADNLI